MTSPPHDDSSPAAPASVSSSAEQSPQRGDLRAWAAALATTLPLLTPSQVAAVARIAARLDASDSLGPAE